MPSCFKIIVLTSALLAAPFASAKPARHGLEASSSTAARFESNASGALLVMQARATELNITGVAVLAYFDGATPKSWSSRMLVVGRMKDDPKGTDKGNNLIGIAYAKASEMADTLKDSGSQVRPPLTGEFGWQGGVILPCGSGYLIAAFSGGKSEDDVLVSRAGAEMLARILHQTPSVASSAVAPSR